MFTVAILIIRTISIHRIRVGPSFEQIPHDFRVPIFRCRDQCRPSSKHPTPEIDHRR